MKKTLGDENKNLLHEIIADAREFVAAQWGSVEAALSAAFAAEDEHAHNTRLALGMTVAEDIKHTFGIDDDAVLDIAPEVALAVFRRAYPPATADALMAAQVGTPTPECPVFAAARAVIGATENICPPAGDAASPEHSAALAMLRSAVLCFAIRDIILIAKQLDPHHRP